MEHIEVTIGTEKTGKSIFSEVTDAIANQKPGYAELTDTFFWEAVRYLGANNGEATTANVIALAQVYATLYVNEVK